MHDKDFEEFKEVLTHFDRAMLVTKTEGDLRARPMVIGDVTDDGRVRFVSRDDSGKLDELTENPQVNVACQGDMRFVSISGNAKMSKDRELIDAAWRSRQSPWFADGKDDPHVIVIEVIPTHIEFWDRSDANLVTRVFGTASKASGKHGDIDLSDEPV